MGNEVRRKLIAFFESEHSTFDPTAGIADQFDLDSLEIVEMYLMLENEFAVSIPDDKRKMKADLEYLTDLIVSLQQ